jgi:hypothetical protein
MKTVDIVVPVVELSAAALQGKGAATEAASSSSNSAAAGESVTELMRKLNLTQKEATPLILEDEDEVDPPCPEWALVGKVLTPNILHVNTIRLIVKSAWGNPKDLIIRPWGPNIFLAEFGSEADRSRVAKGGPWWVGSSKHAILLKEFDVRVRPEDVVFNELPIWVHIKNLGFELMNDTRGIPLAALIGKVERLDVDENGRAWGSYLRARVTIDASQPIMRCVSTFSKKKNMTMQYDVMYERLPVYCFSCGLLGHSSLLCPTPAARDADGKLPYNGERLCVPDHKKKGAGIFSDQSSKGSWSGNERVSGSAAAGSSSKKKANDGQGDVTSPAKKAPKARKNLVVGLNATPGTVVGGTEKRSAGQKRKQPRQAYVPKVVATVLQGRENQNTRALVVRQDGAVADPLATARQNDVDSDVSHKKQRTSNSGSADLAAAGTQPRHSQ